MKLKHIGDSLRAALLAKMEILFYRGEHDHYMTISFVGSRIIVLRYLEAPLTFEGDNSPEYSEEWYYSYANGCDEFPDLVGYCKEYLDAIQDPNVSVELR